MGLSQDGEGESGSLQQTDWLIDLLEWLIGWLIELLISWLIVDN
jgi:hypothetical protein